MTDQHNPQVFKSVCTLDFHKPPRPALTEILDAVAGETMLLHIEIRGPDHLRPCVHARWLYFWLARKHGYSWPKMAAFIGHDHSTAIHGFRRVEETLPRFAHILAAMEKRLEGAGR